MRALLLTFFALSLALPAASQTPSERQPAPRAPKPATADPQTPKPATTPAVVAVPVPRREGQPVNIKVELAISDQHGATAPLKKTVTVVTGDNMNGFIRSSANYAGGIGPVPLNVDAEPQLLPDGKIRLHVNVEYDLPSPAALGQTDTVPVTERGLRTMQIRENLALILENGKPMIAAQSADPVSDRQVTIEVKATVLR